MLRVPMFVLLGALVVLTGASVGQDTKKENPKAVKKDEPKATRSDEPGVRVKGVLPMNWGKIGLTDAQRQDIYKVQAKYNAEVDKLEAKIKELKASRDKEMKAVLTPDQKKKLEDILTGK